MVRQSVTQPVFLVWWAHLKSPLLCVCVWCVALLAAVQYDRPSDWHLCLAFVLFCMFFTFWNWSIPTARCEKSGAYKSGIRFYFKNRCQFWGNTPEFPKCCLSMLSVISSLPNGTQHTSRPPNEAAHLWAADNVWWIALSFAACHLC